MGRRVGILVAVALAALCLASQAAAFETQLWTIKVVAKPNRAETEKKLSQFDYATSEAYSALGGMSQRTEGSVGYVVKGKPWYDRFLSKEGAYSIETSDDIEVSIECKGPTAEFKGSLKGSADGTASFHDGAASLVDSFIGTGYAKLAVTGGATGDLTYSANRPLKPIALGAFDNKELFELDLEVKGQKLKLAPRAGDGEIPDSTTGSGGNTDFITKKKYAFNLSNVTYSNIKADDSTIGSADAETTMHVTQEATINGRECQMGTLNGTIEVDLSVRQDGVNNPIGRATVKVLTKDGPTTIVEDITYEFDPLRQAKYRRIKRGAADEEVKWDEGWTAGAGGITLLSSPGWPPPASASLSPPAGSAKRGRHVGIPGGSTVLYAVRAPRKSPLGLVKTLRLHVKRIHQKTGKVIFSARARGSGRRHARFRLSGNAYTGADGIWGVVVPKDLDKGDRVLRYGKVVRAQGDLVTVRYRKKQAHGTAFYDRDTGVLINIGVRSKGGKHFSMRLLAAHR